MNTYYADADGAVRELIAEAQVAELRAYAGWGSSEGEDW